ncbi:hypothetical protein H3C67_01545 [Candidatus Dojkabacteria bacterium]|uniref:Uncharacterized protein n=1 Tax=Candidatus Dojkabacteria bacterium TaxID=2099670 RepID=A0A952DUU7_9BACT|nr:hypothetical protein [Candidatus Dojkabacteria bacterium]
MHNYMRAVIAYLCFVFFVLISSFLTVIFTVRSGIVNNPQFSVFSGISGLGRLPNIHNQFYHLSPIHLREGTNAAADNFRVVINNPTISYKYEEIADFEYDYGRQTITLEDNPDMVYKNSFSEQPLFAEDYYYGKYENAAAGVLGLNKMPILRPGDSIGVVKDKYINIKTWNGYIRPTNGYYFGSGVCWSTSALGQLLDNANKSFKEKFGVDLFVYKKGDRAPHGDYYKTYSGRGYTVFQASEGVPLQDYRFTINPEIAGNKDLEGLKLKIVMLATNEHATASHGQSIGGYIISNIEF